MLTDNYNRRISYLRISVTDRCNLRCVYCMPSGGIPFLPASELLSYDEMLNVVKTALSLGITRFRITGGEPLTRPGITGFLRAIARTPSVEWTSLTTNGLLLSEYYNKLKDIGLNSINVSLNSLQEETFSRLTGARGVRKVLGGIESLLQAGFKNIKINTVIMRGLNEQEIPDFVRLTIDKPLAIRFIEYMPCGAWKDDHSGRTIPADELIAGISRIGRLLPVDKPMGHGPARYYQLAGARGLIGFITAVSRPFCNSCNRLRLTADGKLKACLLAADTIDLKPIIRTNFSDSIRQSQLSGAFAEISRLKPKSHHNEELTAMSRIGG